MKRSRLAMVMFVATIGCGAAGRSSTAPMNKAPLEISVNNKPAKLVVLMAEQFIAPGTNKATLELNQDSGKPVRWDAATNDIVTLGDADTGPVWGSPTPPSGGIFVWMTSHLGMTTVEAHVGRAIASIPVYTYQSLALRCQFRYNASYTFDQGSTETGVASDLYVTEAADDADPLNPCHNTPFVTGSSAVHFPYGGVVVPGNRATFPMVTASQWSNAETQLSESAIGNGILLFKTKAGAIVKAMIPLGPYEVTDSTGSFPY